MQDYYIKAILTNAQIAAYIAEGWSLVKTVDGVTEMTKPYVSPYGGA